MNFSAAERLRKMIQARPILSVKICRLHTSRRIIPSIHSFEQQLEEHSFLNSWHLNIEGNLCPNLRQINHSSLTAQSDIPRDISCSQSVKNLLLEVTLVKISSLHTFAFIFITAPTQAPQSEIDLIVEAKQKKAKVHLLFNKSVNSKWATLMSDPIINEFSCKHNYVLSVK